MPTSFYEYLWKLQEDAPPPAAPPPPGGDPMAGGNTPPPPPPGGGNDPLGGMGGGDPGMGGPGQGGTPRKAINITTVWDALRDALGKDAEHKIDVPKPKIQNKEVKKPKSLMQ